MRLSEKTGHASITVPIPRTPCYRRFSGAFPPFNRRYIESVHLHNLANTGRTRKQVLGGVADTLLVVLSLWLAYSLRLGEAFTDLGSTWYLFILLPCLTLGTFAALGVYRWVVRSTNRRLFVQLVKGSLASALLLVLITYLLPPERGSPRSVFIFYGALLLIGTCSVRFLWQGFFDAGRRGEPIAIYGAGAGGRQLAALLAFGHEYRPVVFIDDAKALFGSTVLGLPVLDGEADTLAAALQRNEVCRIVLAMPSLSGKHYRQKLERLERLALPVQTVPAIDELMSGRARADDIRDVAIGDILGRAEVAPDIELLGRRLTGRSVLVTGGGGSIGSELCRQIVRLAPKRLVILDHGEANLYHISEELQRENIEFLPRLGSVTDRRRVDRLLREFAIDTVYHAAAYKHVPIVEEQPWLGVETNVFGTLTLLDAAIANGVEDFVLISTDKAVRPCSAMGASKRAAELLLQAKAHSGIATRVSMVRFGNVLGSSGSVVPKFKKQIQAGGPITLTDPGITRYFMTIPEAAQLVLQASSIARGGDVFVLDMGEPMKILDLARTMTRLYGKRLAEETGDPCDIAIVVEGLRPGEKMFEEMFITDTHRPTSVARIFTADEAWLPWEDLAGRLGELRDAADTDDADKLRDVLMRLAFEGHHGDPMPAMDTTLDDTAAANELREALQSVV